MSGKKKKGHQKSASVQVPQKVGQFTVLTTLHGYAMEGPFTPGPKDVWYCDNKACKYTQHGLYRRYNIENWRSSKFGKKFVLCDGCIRKYRKPECLPQHPHPHHQHQASAPNVNVTLNMQGGGFQQGHPHQPHYGQAYSQPMTIIQPIAQPMAMSNTQSSSLGLGSQQSSYGQYQDYGQQQSAYSVSPQQHVPFTNAKVNGTQISNGVAASDEKTAEGMGYTGPVSQYSNDGTAMSSNATSSSTADPQKQGQGHSVYNGLAMGHGIHIVQQGWMMKQGGLVKNWKRRYFVLKTNKVLNYYESDNSSMVKGSIELSKIIGVERKQKKSFDLVTPKRTWSFACVSTKVRDEWVNNISNVAGLG